MELRVAGDATEAATRAADELAAALRAAVGARGRAVLAVSGGSTPGPMLRALADAGLDWGRVHVAQVDERIAPDGDPDRNLVGLRASLLDHAPVPEANVHLMPVGAGDPDAAVLAYGRALSRLAGGAIDAVHLGLGPDGHTASLVPGDPVLDVTDRWGAVTGTVYQGRRRMTLTYPALAAARRVVFLVAGADKARALARLLARDPGIPAGRLPQDAAVVFADAAAGGASGAAGAR